MIPLLRLFAYKLGLGEDHIGDLCNQAYIDNVRDRSRETKDMPKLMADLRADARNMNVGDEELKNQANKWILKNSFVGAMKMMRSLIFWRYLATGIALAIPFFAVLGMDSCMQLCRGIPINRFDDGGNYAITAILISAVVARFGNFKKFLVLVAASAAVLYYGFYIGDPHDQDRYPGALILVILFYLIVSGFTLFFAWIREYGVVSIGLGQTDNIDCVSKVENGGGGESIRLSVPRRHRTRWNIAFVLLLLAALFWPHLYTGAFAKVSRPLACVVAKPILSLRKVDYYHRDDFVCEAHGPKPADKYPPGQDPNRECSVHVYPCPAGR